MKSIALIGFMGSGKTSIGQALARKLGMQLLDLDEEIERREGMEVGRIFVEKGECYFRTREREVLRELSGGDQVLSIGGGAFTADDNIALINSIAVSVWIDCPLPICLARCARSPHMRPLFSSPEDMARLYKHRRRFYKKAHKRIRCNDESPGEIADRIMELLKLEPRPEE